MAQGNVKFIRVRGRVIPIDDSFQKRIEARERREKHARSTAAGGLAGGGVGLLGAHLKNKHRGFTSTRFRLRTDMTKWRDIRKGYLADTNVIDMAKFKKAKPKLAKVKGKVSKSLRILANPDLPEVKTRRLFKGWIGGYLVGGSIGVAGSMIHSYFQRRNDGSK